MVSVCGGMVGSRREEVEGSEEDDEEETLMGGSGSLLDPPKEPMTVETQVVVNHLGPFDVKANEAQIKFEISLSWADPREKAKDKEDRWTPKLNIFNSLGSPIVVRSPIFYDSSSGACGLDITYEGRVAAHNDRQSLRDFPMDAMEVLVQIDGCDDYGYDGVLDLRAFPENTISPIKQGQAALKFNDQYNPADSLNDWQVVGVRMQEKLTKWSRSYKRIFVQFKVLRNPHAHLRRMVLPLYMLNVLSLAAFLMPSSTEFASRISYILTLFLATTAFLFLIRPDVPNTTFATRMDKLTIHTYLMQFLIGLATIGQKLALKIHYDSVLQLDKYMGIGCLVCAHWPFAFQWVPTFLLYLKTSSRYRRTNFTLEATRMNKDPKSRFETDPSGFGREHHAGCYKKISAAD